MTRISGVSPDTGRAFFCCNREKGALKCRPLPWEHLGSPALKAEFTRPAAPSEEHHECCRLQTGTLHAGSADLLSQLPPELKASS